MGREAHATADLEVGATYLRISSKIPGSKNPRAWKRLAAMSAVLLPFVTSAAAAVTFSVRQEPDLPKRTTSAKRMGFNWCSLMGLPILRLRAVVCASR